MLVIQEYIPITKAKAAFLDIIRKIEDSEDAIAITKNGVPEAVLLSMRKFEGLLETLEILSDEKSMKSIRKSIKKAQNVSLSAYVLFSVAFFFLVVFAFMKKMVFISFFASITFVLCLCILGLKIKYDSEQQR